MPSDRQKCYDCCLCPLFFYASITFSISPTLQWSEKITQLENDVRERDSIIFTQQHIINEMQRQVYTAALLSKHTISHAALMLLLFSDFLATIFIRKFPNCPHLYKTADAEPRCCYCFVTFKQQFPLEIFLSALLLSCGPSSRNQRKNAKGASISPVLS